MAARIFFKSTAARPSQVATVMMLIVWAIFSSFALTGAHLAFADEGRKLPTIGLAVPIDAASDAPYQKAFRDGLRDLGYVEGKNVTLIVRYSNGDPAKYQSHPIAAVT